MQKSPILWLPDLQGMNNRQDMDKIPDNASPLLKNISLDRPGIWGKRKGSSLLGTTSAGSGVQGLITYNKNDGTNVLRSVRGGNLDVYTAGTWSTIDASQFSTGRVFSVNYKGAVYHASESVFLCYETGGACTDVGTGNDRIKGRCIASAQNTLFIGHIYATGAGTVAYEDRVYYSLFDSSNNVPGHQFWNDAEGSLAASTRWFTLNEPVRGLFSYSATGLVYAFTDNKCYSFNMIGASNQTGIKGEFDIGLAHQRAITECNGWMVWMSPDKRIWAWGGAGLPKPISWDLEDDDGGASVINSIATTDQGTINAGSMGNVFYFSVGDVVLYNETVTNAVIKGLATTDFSYILWSLESYPYRPVIFSKGRDTYKSVMYVGMDDINDVYQFNVGTNDGSTAVQAFARTKFHDFGLPADTKELVTLYIKYRPQSTTNNYLRVRFAKDGELNYVTITDPDNSVINHGIINMYASDSSTRLSRVDKIQMRKGYQFRTISIEIGNLQSSEDFEVSAIGFEFAGSTKLQIRHKA